MTTVAISGINGFVGHHLARELHNNDISIIGIGRENEVHDEISSIVTSYYSADLITEWPDIGDVDAVIHLAGLAAVGPSFDNPQQYISANSSMVTNLCEYYAPRDKKPRIVSVSSGAVYSSDQSMPITEESSIGFNSPYAVSKILTENQCKYYRTRGIDCIIARPFNHIGPGQNQGFLLPDLFTGLKKASSDNTPLLVGNLSTERDYTDVRDVAAAYRLLATTPSLSYDTYNICSGTSTAGKEILTTLQAKTGLSGVEIEIDQSRIRPNDPAKIYGDTTRLKQDTDWRPAFSLEQTITDFIG